MTFLQKEWQFHNRRKTYIWYKRTSLAPLVKLQNIYFVSFIGLGHGRLKKSFKIQKKLVISSFVKFAMLLNVITLRPRLLITLMKKITDGPYSVVANRWDLITISWCQHKHGSRKSAFTVSNRSLFPYPFSRNMLQNNNDNLCLRPPLVYNDHIIWDQNSNL